MILKRKKSQLGKKYYLCIWNFRRQENMDMEVKTAEIKTEDCTEEKQLYSVEEVFDIIDNEFIDFYGEYGRKIVNTRRSEWNQDGIVNLKISCTFAE